MSGAAILTILVHYAASIAYNSHIDWQILVLDCDLPIMFGVDFYRASICEGSPGSRNSVRPSARP